MFSFQVIYEISEKQICCLGGCIFYEEVLEPTARETEKYQFSQTTQDDFIQFLIKMSQSRQNDRRNELPAATTIPTQVVFIIHTEYITHSYHSGSLERGPNYHPRYFHLSVTRQLLTRRVRNRVVWGRMRLITV